MRGCRQAVWTFGLLSAALLSPIAAQAQGQGRGGMGMAGMAGPGLIANPAIEKELKLSDEQKQKAASFATAFREKAREAYPSTEGLEGQERIKGIVLQVRGYEAFTDPTIVKEFKITKDQEDKIKNLAESARSEMNEARQSAGDDREAMMAGMTKIRKESDTKAPAMMSDAEKKM